MLFRNGFLLVYNTRYFLTQKPLQKYNVSSTHAKSFTVTIKIERFEEINNSTFRIYSKIILDIVLLQDIVPFIHITLLMYFSGFMGFIYIWGERGWGFVLK